MRQRFISLVPLAALLALVACDTWLGDKKAPPLKGTRIAVLAHAQEMKATPEALEKLALPKPYRNASWPQAGGYSHHAMHHLALSDKIGKAWSSSGGSGGGSRDRLLASPTMAEGKVFVMDADSKVRALDSKTGATVWKIGVMPKGEDGGTLASGGIAYDDGKLFVTSGFGEMVALAAKTGAELWRKPLGAPVRAAPTVSGDRVFAVNKDNEVHALSVDDGRLLWTYTGIAEVASLLGAASPAVDAGVVVVALSSGDLHALKVENGAVAWSESLTAMRRTTAVANMADIRGRPVIDRGRVYATGHSGMTVAIDLRSGQRLWEAEIGGIDQPWVAGDYLFLLTGDGELAAVETRTGRVAWITPLQKWRDETDRTGRILWTGPILAGDRLIVAGSQGQAVTVSPYTGALLGKVKLPDGVSLAPIVADQTLYMFTDDADLVAYR